MTDEHAAWKYIYAKLTAFAGLTSLLPVGVGAAKAIYEHPAPQSSLRPLVTITKLSNAQHMSQMTHIGATEFRFLVRAIGPDSSKKQVLEIAKQIDAALHEVSGTETGWQIDSYRSEPFSMPEPDQGRVWHHAGSVFTVWVRPAS